jgi:hypothetical protein
MKLIFMKVAKRVVCAAQIIFSRVFLHLPRAYSMDGNVVLLSQEIIQDRKGYKRHNYTKAN